MPWPAPGPGRSSRGAGAGDVGGRPVTVTDRRDGLGPLSAPNRHALVTGWRLVDLGRPEAAAECWIARCRWCRSPPAGRRPGSARGRRSRTRWPATRARRRPWCGAAAGREPGRLGHRPGRSAPAVEGAGPVGTPAGDRPGPDRSGRRAAAVLRVTGSGGNGNPFFPPPRSCHAAPTAPAPIRPREVFYWCMDGAGSLARTSRLRMSTTVDEPGYSWPAASRLPGLAVDPAGCSPARPQSSSIRGGREFDVGMTRRHRAADPLGVDHLGRAQSSCSGSPRARRPADRPVRTGRTGRGTGMHRRGNAPAYLRRWTDVRHPARPSPGRTVTVHAEPWPPRSPARSPPLR